MMRIVHSILKLLLMSKGHNCIFILQYSNKDEQQVFHRLKNYLYYTESNRSSATTYDIKTAKKY